MKNKIELQRAKLEKLIVEKGKLIDSEVVFLSQELDKLIVNYLLCETEI